ncbi:hypothetical protein [Microbacterium rhizophilus]|uniref:hypothetical protein n=1 Tax=Microbacterium rhizophilus TaxID=3138934 RepID=UPI0031EF7528
MIGEVVLAVIALLGGGTIVQLLNIRHSRRLADRGQDVTEDDALVKRWEALVRTQTEALIQPLQAQIDGLKSELDQVKRDLTTARNEASEERSRYWRAVGYIRVLRTLIDRNIDPADVTIPAPPVDIANDI